jgi:excisionase family DNA binding protein
MDDEISRAANAKKGSPFLNTDQAAHYVGLSRRTLEKMRTAGEGPRFRKHGRYVRYHIDDLDAWSLGQGKASTSDAGTKGAR